MSDVTNRILFIDLGKKAEKDKNYFLAGQYYRNVSDSFRYSNKYNAAREYDNLSKRMFELAEAQKNGSDAISKPVTEPVGEVKRPWFWDKKKEPEPEEAPVEKESNSFNDWYHGFLHTGKSAPKKKKGPEYCPKCGTRMEVQPKFENGVNIGYFYWCRKDGYIRKISDDDTPAATPEPAAGSSVMGLKWYRGAKDAKDRRIKDLKEKDSYQKVAKYAGTEGITTILRILILFVFFLGINYMAMVYPDSVLDIVQTLGLTVIGIIMIILGRSVVSPNTPENDRNDIINMGRIVVFVGLIAIFVLSSAIYGFLWLKTIICIIIALLIYADFESQSFVVSFMMLLLFLFLWWAAVSGWLTIIGAKVDTVSDQLGFGDAFSSSTVAINQGLSTIWLILTDPNKWYAEQELQQGVEKDEGQSDRAVEVSEVGVVPKTINSEDGEASVIVEVENMGDGDAERRTAKNVLLYVRKLGDNSGSISLDGASEENSDMVFDDVNDMIPQAKARKYFTVLGPQSCVGTFKIEGGVKYDYSVDASSDIDVISRERYDTLLNQGKLVVDNAETESSAGPLSIGIRSDVDPPLPVLAKDKAADDENVIPVYITFINERPADSEVYVYKTEITIPLELQIYTGEGAKCDLRRDSETGIYEIFVEDEEPDFEDYKNLFSEEVNFIVEGDMRIFKCDMKYLGEAPSFETPIHIHVSADYGYRTSKTVSLYVKDLNVVDGVTTPKCT